MARDIAILSEELAVVPSHRSLAREARSDFTLVGRKPPSSGTSKLSKEEEHALIRDYREHQSESALKHLIRAHDESCRRYAIASAKKIGRDDLIDDLYQEARLGVIRAIEKFDPIYGVKLKSYASYWMRAFVGNYINSNRTPHKRSIEIQDLDRKLLGEYKKIKEELLRRSGSFTLSPSDKNELEERLGVPLSKIKELHLMYYDTGVFLNAPSRADDFNSGTLVDNFRGVEPETILDVVEQNSDREYLELLLADPRIDTREKYVIEQLYLDPEERDMEDLGRELGITRERVRQIRNKCQEKLYNLALQYSYGIYDTSLPLDYYNVPQEDSVLYMEGLGKLPTRRMGRSKAPLIEDESPYAQTGWLPCAAHKFQRGHKKRFEEVNKTGVPQILTYQGVQKGIVVPMDAAYQLPLLADNVSVVTVNQYDFFDKGDIGARTLDDSTIYLIQDQQEEPVGVIMALSALPVIRCITSKGFDFERALAVLRRASANTESTGNDHVGEKVAMPHPKLVLAHP